jgi:integrase/recombinase XerD
MTTAAPSTALVTIQPPFTDPERLALAGFLAGYRGLTREAYTLDLRQFTTWCRTRSLPLFAVRRADIEGFARDLEARGRTRATVTRRLSTIAGFYKYAVEEELLDHSPAAHVRRPAWIMSPMPPPWTATNWGPCWWPPGSGCRSSMR